MDILEDYNEIYPSEIRWKIEDKDPEIIYQKEYFRSLLILY
jgi:hypothetical protein